jgi:hypothetical protein
MDPGGPMPRSKLNCSATIADDLNEISPPRESEFDTRSNFRFYFFQLIRVNLLKMVNFGDSYPLLSCSHGNHCNTFHPSKQGDGLKHFKSTSFSVIK